MRANSWKNNPVTTVLVTIQVIVFILMTLAGGSTNNLVLLKFGALSTQLVQAGEWWRLLTPVFVHIGFAHILINSITLYFIGIYIEQLFGHWRMLVIYLASALAGNLLSAYLLPMSLSAGASTAIFGMFGAFIMLGLTFREYPAIRYLSRQFLVLVVLNIVTDLMVPGIDLAGHLGGLVGGFLVAYTVGAPKIGQVNRVERLIATIVLLLGLVVLFLKVS
ncbi:MAG: rhomboid family intramembrane serine protease [Limosilactobacillus sp.]|uniref:rhomboid family intramembrane serine protease n=1 Tax=Limosilactobacillus sp. TaxID=2773925 RepID=UPI0026FF2079|nr:rhomboid family intramembrane serine protease [Limosilactobacillus sp.]